jgi:tripartite-type tricarboxylate transporter receptor subunit TctC
MMPRLRRRTLLGAAVTSLGAPALAQGLTPGAWPLRPITLIAPYPPGGSSDNVARPISIPLAAALGQNVIIENRGGPAARSALLRSPRRGPMAIRCWSGRPRS